MEGESAFLDFAVAFLHVVGQARYTRAVVLEIDKEFLSHRPLFNGVTL
jgi:hypothetical protein